MRTDEMLKVEDLHADLVAARAEIERLRAALKPFADWAKRDNYEING